MGSKKILDGKLGHFFVQNPYDMGHIRRSCSHKQLFAYAKTTQHFERQCWLSIFDSDQLTL